MGLRGEHCRSLSVRRIQGRQSNSFPILLPPFSGATCRECTNPSPYAVPTQYRKQFPPWYLNSRRPRLLSPVLHLKRHHGSGTRNFCANPHIVPEWYFLFACNRYCRTLLQGRAMVSKLLSRLNAKEHNLAVFRSLLHSYTTWRPVRRRAFC